MTQKLNFWASVLAGIGFAASVTGCTKAEDVQSEPKKPEKELKDLYPNNQRPSVVRLYKDTVYILSDNRFIESGERLIIEPGTIIKANQTGSSISIRPGGILEAVGTAADPIVFTANKRPGDQANDWAGITVQGKSFDNGAPNSLINPNDTSGTLRFVRIEFAPLTLQGVGQGTVLDHIMVSYAGRPLQGQAYAAFSVIGGTFNASHLVSYAAGGSADFYITNGYTGQLQYLLAYRHPFFGQTGSFPTAALAGMYIENNRFNQAGAMPLTNPVISNATVIGPGTQTGVVAAYTDTATSVRSAALVTARNARFRIRNSAFLGFPAGGYRLDDAATGANLINGNAEITHSSFQTAYANRVFFLTAGAFAPYTSADLRTYLLQPAFRNNGLSTPADFGLQAPFDYRDPKPFPSEGSPLLKAPVDFSGPAFTGFLERVAFRGAFGTDNWLQGWTNFTPLKTNYNFPE